MLLDWLKPFFFFLGISPFYTAVQNHSYSHHRTIGKERAPASLQLISNAHHFETWVLALERLWECSAVLLSSCDLPSKPSLPSSSTARCVPGKYLGTAGMWFIASGGCCSHSQVKRMERSRQSAFIWTVLGMYGMKFHFLTRNFFFFWSQDPYFGILAALTDGVIASESKK